MQVAVLNGVNLNALGDRDPALYGGLSLNELENRIYRWGRELGLQVVCRQTNHEGQFVDWCHESRPWATGIILNPGAWAHYSYAIRDAVELFSCPVVEVHLSDVTKREEWRRTSVLTDVVAARIVGKGPEGYREGLLHLAEHR
ncbi:MAG: 3-dehydroquinate dehydratase [Actinomycetota bacterium]|nr:3-dehydroquinate dehydratase [Actinomycetota bacterium]